MRVKKPKQVNRNSLNWWCGQHWGMRWNHPVKSKLKLSAPRGKRRCGPESLVLFDESQRQGEAVIARTGETSKSSSVENENKGEGASAVAAGLGKGRGTSVNGKQARALGSSDLASPFLVDGGDPPAQTGGASVSCLVARGAVVAGLLPSALPSVLGDAVPFLSIVVSAPRLVAWGGLGSG